MSELSSTIIIVVLIGTNLLTIWFYQKQLSQLIDKAMSRSYPEYVQTKNLEQSERFPASGTQGEKPSGDDPALNELNSMFS